MGFGFFSDISTGFLKGRELVDEGDYRISAHAFDETTGVQRKLFGWIRAKSNLWFYLNDGHAVAPFTTHAPDFEFCVNKQAQNIFAR